MQDIDFFEQLLERLSKSFKDGNMSIVKCIQKEDGKELYALAETKVSQVSHELEFTPVAFFWNKNPLQSMYKADRPLMASQKSLSEWEVVAEATPVADGKVLN